MSDNYVFSPVNRDKNHYFIGNIFNDEHQIKILRIIQKKLRKKYALKNFHWNNKFYTNLIYLGYFDKETADLYMTNIISHLLNALSKDIPELKCKYTDFKLSYDKSFYKISLKLTDENNLLEKIIIPYLHKNAVDPIYNQKKIMLKPSIDLIYYKYSPIIKHQKESIRIQVPEDTFKIDHFALIKGTTINLRAGTPSLHDQMSLEEVHKYVFPLKKNTSYT